MRVLRGYKPSTDEYQEGKRARNQSTWCDDDEKSLFFSAKYFMNKEFIIYMAIGHLSKLVVSHPSTTKFRYASLNWYTHMHRVDFRLWSPTAYLYLCESAAVRHISLFFLCIIVSHKIRNLCYAAIPGCYCEYLFTYILCTHTPVSAKLGLILIILTVTWRL